MFFAPKFFWGRLLEILDQDDKIEHASEHRAQFRGDRPMELEDLMPVNFSLISFIVLHHIVLVLCVQDNAIQYVNLDTEIQYVDLDLAQCPGGSTDPLRGRTQSASNATEYHEVDWLKTETLANLRKFVDDERETSEK